MQPNILISITCPHHCTKHISPHSHT
uniref:Uncharacterized protein n=1 Tax=Arundo donax TaxID=35708 RepID=A0A0A9C2Y3_ARUDO